MIKVPVNLIKKHATFIGLQEVPWGHQYYPPNGYVIISIFAKNADFQIVRHALFLPFPEKLKKKKQAEYLRKQAHHTVTLFQTMAVESVENESPVSAIIADRSVPAPQDTHSTKNAINQVDYNSVKP